MESCKDVVQTTILTVNLEKLSSPTRIRLQFTNRGKNSLWLPIEKQPSFRVDERANALTIFYGYFDEVYGGHQEHYILPAMQEAKPGEGKTWDISDRTLIDKALKSGHRVQARMRVALREFRQNRTRGAQDLEGYLKESCVIESVGFLSTPR
jgi:hypothetical protein